MPGVQRLIERVRSSPIRKFQPVKPVNFELFCVSSLSRVRAFCNGRLKKGAQTMNKTQEQFDSDDYVWVFCKEYTNRWGQLMVAADYGYQFWRFKIRRRRKG